MPSGGYMSGIFGSSPVSPLQKHMSKVYACTSELVPLFNAVINDELVKAGSSFTLKGIFS